MFWTTQDILKNLLKSSLSAYVVTLHTEMTILLTLENLLRARVCVCVCVCVCVRMSLMICIYTHTYTHTYTYLADNGGGATAVGSK